MHKEIKVVVEPFLVIDRKLVGEKGVEAKIGDKWVTFDTINLAIEAFKEYWEAKEMSTTHELKTQRFSLGKEV